MVLSPKDIHNHLLPGLDDGFQKEESSLAAIAKMASEGCRELVFTPHMNPDVYPGMSEEDFRKAYDAFVPKIPSELCVRTQLGAEYMVVKDFEKRVEAHPETLLTFDDGSILIEMSYYFRSLNLEETVFQLGLAGLRPIIAHPERYSYMAGCLKDFDRLRDMGCRFQLNLLSLAGVYGPPSIKIARYIAKKGWYDFAATDLHALGQLEMILSAKPNFWMRKVRP